MEPGIAGLRANPIAAYFRKSMGVVRWLRWWPKKRLYETYFRQFGSAGQWDGPYTCVLIVLSIRHRGLRSLLEDDNSRFLPPNLVDLVRKILTVLILAEHIDGFIGNAPPGRRVHKLSGNRRNEWSISVSGNWRITFEEEGGHINGLNLEDYH